MAGFGTCRATAAPDANEDFPLNATLSAITLAACLLAGESRAGTSVKVGSLEALAKAIEGAGPARRSCWPTAPTGPHRSASRENAARRNRRSFSARSTAAGPRSTARPAS